MHVDRVDALSGGTQEAVGIAPCLQFLGTRLRSFCWQPFTRKTSIFVP